MLEGVNQTKDCAEDEHRTQILGKIIESKKENEFIVETLDKKNTILVNITNDTAYEEGISHEFELGNIVMFEIINAIIISDNSCQSTITKIIANDKDEVITVDKRETISGYLGVFPDGVLDYNHTEITVKEETIVAVVLEQQKGESFEYEIEDGHLTLISEGEEDLGNHYNEHYWGFVAKNKGEHQLTFSRINKDNEVLEEIGFLITISFP